MLTTLQVFTSSLWNKYYCLHFTDRENGFSNLLLAKSDLEFIDGCLLRFYTPWTNSSALIPLPAGHATPHVCLGSEPEHSAASSVYYWNARISYLLISDRFNSPEHLGHFSNS